MIMARFVVFLLLLFSATAGWAQLGSKNITRYSRSDCIVEVDFSEGIYKEGSWQKLTQDINGIFIGKRFHKKYPNIADIGSQYRRSDTVPRIYIQYLRNCENRIQMASNLMEYFKSRIADFPAYIVLEKRIQPNPRTTIDVCGRFWVDCKPENLPAPTSSTREKNGVSDKGGSALSKG